MKNLEQAKAEMTVALKNVMEGFGLKVTNAIQDGEKGGWIPNCDTLMEYGYFTIGVEATYDAKKHYFVNEVIAKAWIGRISTSDVTTLHQAQAELALITNIVGAVNALGLTYFSEPTYGYGLLKYSSKGDFPDTIEYDGQTLYKEEGDFEYRTIPTKMLSIRYTPKDTDAYRVYMDAAGNTKVD